MKNEVGLWVASVSLPTASGLWIARVRGKRGSSDQQNCKTLFAPDLIEQKILQHIQSQNSGLMRATQQYCFDNFCTKRLALYKQVKPIQVS